MSWSGSWVRLRFLSTLPLRVNGLIPPLDLGAEEEVVERVGAGYGSNGGGGGSLLGRVDGEDVLIRGIALGLLLGIGDRRIEMGRMGVIVGGSLLWDSPLVVGSPEEGTEVVRIHLF